MKDPLMENILKGFDQAGQDRIAAQASTTGQGVVTVNDGGSMLDILKGFNDVNPVNEESGLNSGPGPSPLPHMKGRDKMPAATADKHPAKGKLVGEEEIEDGDVVAEDEIEEDTISPKQSMSDILRSMEEADEDRESRYKQELQDEMHPRKLEKNDKGTFDLSENRWADPKVAKKDLVVALRNFNTYVKECDDVDALTDATEFVNKASEVIIKSQYGK